MRAVQLSRFGGPEVLELIEMPTPVPHAGEVLIEIRAAGVNYFEVLMRQDRYAVTPELPTVFGVEVAGLAPQTNSERIGGPSTSPSKAAPRRFMLMTRLRGNC